MSKSKPKATPEETQRRVDFAKQQLCKRLFRSQVVQAVGNKFKLGVKQTNEIVNRAQEQVLQEREGRTQSDELEKSIEFYLSVIRSPSTPPRDKLVAQTRIDKLLGLDKNATTSVLDPEAVKKLYETLLQPPPPPIED